jgi:hypothetical protein
MLPEISDYRSMPGLKISKVEVARKKVILILSTQMLDRADKIGTCSLEFKGLCAVGYLTR